MFKSFILFLEIVFYSIILDIVLVFTVLFKSEKIEKRKIEFNRIYYTINYVKDQLEKSAEKMKENKNDDSSDMEIQKIIENMNKLKELYKTAIKLLLS